MGVFATALMKLAETEFPNYHTDNQEVALKEHDQSLKDSASTLKELFTQAGPTEKADSALISKILPKKGGMGRETSDPLLKIAANMQMLLRDADHIPWDMRQVMALSFSQELDKLASLSEIGQGAAQALGGVSKPVAAMGPAMGAAAKPLSGGIRPMPQAKASSVVAPKGAL